MKIIAICGKPNSKKDYVAMKLSENSDISYVRPYSDKSIPVNIEPYESDDSYVYLSEYKLSVKMDKEVPLAVREIKGHRYVFFENQLRAEYVVLILDEATLDQLRKDYDGEIFAIYTTVTTCSHPEKYDVVFNPDTDDIDLLEVKLYE